MGAHIEHTGDNLSFLSIAFIILAAIGIGTIAVILSAISAIISIIINWPKFKVRAVEIREWICKPFRKNKKQP